MDMEQLTRRKMLATAAITLGLVALGREASGQPRSNEQLTPVKRSYAEADKLAADIEAKMTDDERFSLLFSLMPNVFPKFTREPRVPADLPSVAGYVPGVGRLGVPPLVAIDASLGIRHINGPNPGATALPAALALGATFLPNRGGGGEAGPPARLRAGRAKARRVTPGKVDRRSALARAIDIKAGKWSIAKGTYRVAVGRAANDWVLMADAEPTARLFGN